MEFFFGGEIKWRWKRKITCGEENLFFQGRAKARKKNEETKICFFAGEKIKKKIFGKYIFLRRRSKTEKEKEDHLREAGPSR